MRCLALRCLALRCVMLRCIPLRQVREGKLEYDRAMGELHRRKEQLLAEVEAQEDELRRLQVSL